MAGNSGRKMGMVQLGLLTVAALLVAGALVVKAKRADMTAQGQMAAEYAPAAGREARDRYAAGQGDQEHPLPQRTFGQNAVPPHLSSENGDAPVSSDGAPGVSAGHEPGGDIAPHPGQADDVPVMKDADCSAYEGWVGKPVDRAAVEATGKPFRILKPGDMMTMDFNPERINVETDEAGAVVQRVFCG